MRPGRSFVSSLITGALVLTSAVAVVTAIPVAAEAAPSVRYTVVTSGMDHPWDITWMARNLQLITERQGVLWSKRDGADRRRVTVTGFPSFYAQGEGGLMGLVADPSTATERRGRFYTCQATRTGSGAKQDIRVLRWRLTSDTTATADNVGSRGNVVVSGLPLKDSGRHSGCRLRFGADDKLYVGTGDTAVGTNPQDLSSLGGKVLRVGWDGAIPTDNPFYSRGGNARYVWTYGHRNVQGLALRPGTSQMWSVEQGTGRDDEVNLLSKGGNYGYDPVPGYNEAVPMTDTDKYPSAIRARWSSGNPTIATSGGTFLTGSIWGGWQGWMVLGVLKDQRLELLRLDLTGKVVGATTLPGSDQFGRIREPQIAPDGSLWFTTDNGGGQDKIIRVTPTSVPLAATRAGQITLPTGVSAARTGSDVYVFIRSTGDHVLFRRSYDDGRSWGRWRDSGVTSTNAPSVTSSRNGRIDLVTRGSGGVVHTWFDNGIRAGQTTLGGAVLAQHVSSPGDGTLDVFVTGTTGAVSRKHNDGTSWSGWRSLNGVVTSAVSASVDQTTKITTLTARGTGPARTFERTVTPTSDGRVWGSRTDGLSLYSARALGDTFPNVGRVAVAVGADGTLVVQRGNLIMGVRTYYNANPDVVTRPDGTFMIFGRSGDGAAWLYDARPGGYTNVSFGGVVR